MFLSARSINFKIHNLMPDHYLQTFLELTSTFVFSTPDGKDADGLNSDDHRERLLDLIQQVQRMAKRKYYQMPEGLRNGYEQDDWVQEAAMAMMECCRKYDGTRPFDHFVRFTVTRRLTDIQRRIFRHNPPTHQAMFSLIQELKRELKRDPTVSEIADYTGRPENEIATILESGFSTRMVVSGLDLDQGTEGHTLSSGTTQLTGEYDFLSHSSKPGASVESSYLQQEARKVLWECLDEMLPEDRGVYLHHEFNNHSFASIYKEMEIKSMSLATFKRRYISDIYNPVRDCVVSRYQAQG